MSATPLPWLFTERLMLRRFTPADIDELVLLDSDPRVLKFINGGHPMPLAEVAKTMKRVTGYYPVYPGLGVWRASRRRDDAFVGWYCLKYCPPTTDVEVGYRLLHRHWGNGYATEGASALVRFGFEVLGLHRIIGVTHPRNKASQNVLMKSGLADRGWGRYYDRRVRLFEAGHA